jgi:hypothetical protein
MKALANAKCIPFVEVSAKTNYNIETLFQQCARNLYQKLAFPRYTPPGIVKHIPHSLLIAAESVFRPLAGLNPDADWVLNGEKDLKGEHHKCSIQ